MNSLFRTNVSKMDVLDKSVAINRTILRAWSAFGAFAQIFNISRLIIFTDSNISTLNSRIYLGFYIFCLVCSIGFLVSDFVFKIKLLHLYPVQSEDILRMRALFLSIKGKTKW